MILEASVQYLRFPGDNDKEDTESNCLSQFARKQKQNPWVSEERMTEKEEREKEEKMRTRYRPSRAWFARFSDLENLNWVFLKVLSPLDSSMLGTNILRWDIYRIYDPYESTSHQSVSSAPHFHSHSCLFMTYRIRSMRKEISLLLSTDMSAILANNSN